jgi:uncharacterized membrane protein YuzA (DUF378 family)
MKLLTQVITVVGAINGVLSLVKNVDDVKKILKPKKKGFFKRK